MGYVRNNLAIGESIVLEAKVSLTRLIPSIIVAILLAIVGSAAGAGGFFICLLLGVLYVAGTYLTLREIELVVTNKIIRGKIGWIKRQQMDSPLDKVNQVSCHNTLIGAIFKYGTITVATSSGTYNFKYIKDATDFKNQVMNTVEQYKEDQMALQAQKIAMAMHGASM